MSNRSITQPFGLLLAHRQRLRIRDNKGNLLGSSSEFGSSRGDTHETSHQTEQMLASKGETTMPPRRATRNNPEVSDEHEMSHRQRY
ncbi:hypothetical protein LINGRAPRIM_LOCUS72 [Linum grandiflorum]